MAEKIQAPKATDVTKALKKLADPAKAKTLAKYFQTGKGQYGEGDVFIGVTVPQNNSLAKTFRTLPLTEVTKLIKSKIHEERFVATCILTLQYAKATDETTKKKLYKFYLKNLEFINNWGLVDNSAEFIAGPYMLAHPSERKLLFKLAKSKNVWHRRVAVLTTLHFIWNNRYNETFELAEMLLKEEHDLIHKAVGWMLREIGKRDMAQEIKFLDKHVKAMPRTMLRYAIEKFPEPKRQHYLKL